MNDQDSAISTTQNDVTTRLRDSSDTPEHSSGVNTVKRKKLLFKIKPVLKVLLGCQDPIGSSATETQKPRSHPVTSVLKPY